MVVGRRFWLEIVSQCCERALKRGMIERSRGEDMKLGEGADGMSRA